MKEIYACLFICFAVVYCFYNIQAWFVRQAIEEMNTKTSDVANAPEKVVDQIDKKIEYPTKSRRISMHYDNACSVLEIFTKKALRKERKKIEPLIDNDSITTMGIIVFLLVLVIQAVVDAIKVKEEERALKKLYKNGERRQSLAEFAKRKQLRRESSKFGCQLFQITESFMGSDDKKTEDDRKTITRENLTNSPAADENEKSAVEVLDPKIHNKKQSFTNLVDRRAAMVRRSTAPALHAPPGAFAALKTHRPASVDVVEPEEKGRRVRIIRRY